MKSIYLVKAEQGEYSDFEVWNVKAFNSEESANSFCETLNKQSKEAFELYDASRKNKAFKVVANEAEQVLKTIDPKASGHYTLIEYKVETINIE